jgi:hypothetical protein
MHTYKFSLLPTVAKRCAVDLFICAVALALSPAIHGGTMTAAHDDDTAQGTADWTDLGDDVLVHKKTQLQWTKKDSGRDIDWQDAKSYCAEKPAGWRLPSVEELAALYEEAERWRYATPCGDAVACKASPLFHLTGAWFWSNAPVGNDSADSLELAWGVLLVNGRRTKALKEFPFGSRALCVRSL